MKNILLPVLLSIIIVSCSNESSSDEFAIITPNEEDSSNPIISEKDLLRQNGDYPHFLEYENGRVSKSWAYGHTYRSQMIYNSNGTLSGKYIEGGFTTHENFDWEF